MKLCKASGDGEGMMHGSWSDTMGVRRSEGGVNELNMEEGEEIL